VGQPAAGQRPRFLAGRGRSASQGLDAYFGPVDRRVTRTVAALWLIAIVSFLTGISSVRQGGPAGPGGGCAYRLLDHGGYTCVSKTAYDLAGAGVQRIACGGFLAFFAIHLYAAVASGRVGSPAPAARPRA